MLVHFRHDGFVLPFALLLSMSILVFASISLEQAIQARFRQHDRLQRDRAMATVRAFIPEALHHAEILMEKETSASARLYRQIEDAFLPVQGMWYEAGNQWKAISSLEGSSSDELLLFKSPVANIHYAASWFPLDPDSTGNGMDLAWSMEDILLNDAMNPPPEWWPLDSWDMAPVLNRGTVTEQYRDITGETAGIMNPIPVNESIPFAPEYSPSQVPVVRSLGLRFGVFASGALGSREKMVRIRFYVEGQLWNPYNRPIRIHNRSGMEPAFRLVFHHLPDIRIENLSTGHTTGWQSMDGLHNPSSGDTGFHAWIRMPAELPAGEFLNFVEPDEHHQPEGLARTLHPSFLVGPADTIRVVFRDHPMGTAVTCLQIGQSDPLQSALDGRGWFRIEDVSIRFAALEFPRADAPQRPFYLADGSIAFRPANTHIQLQLQTEALRLENRLDPRIKVFNTGRASIDASGNEISHADLVRAQAVNLMEEPPLERNQSPTLSILSWPSAEPPFLLQATDSTEWQNGLFLGSPNATSANAMLDRTWPCVVDTPIQLEMTDGRNVAFQPILPVNCLSSSRWYAAISSSSAGHPGYARFATPSGASDWFTPGPSMIATCSERLVTGLRTRPVRSVGEFFNTGKLVRALEPVVREDPLADLLPLRAWLRGSPAVVPHGTAWILHLAVRIRRGWREHTQSARAWLLALPDANGKTTLRMIRFEWTDPTLHLADAGR